jgi:hypothetical protein
MTNPRSLTRRKRSARFTTRRNDYVSEQKLGYPRHLRAGWPEARQLAFSRGHFSIASRAHRTRSITS